MVATIAVRDGPRQRAQRSKSRIDSVARPFSHHFARRLGRVLAAVCAVAICGVFGAPGVSAAGGTWGAAHIPYASGVVCTEGLQTSPLASWNFGDPALDFLTTSVT